jgi:hypothetical protein
MKLRSRLLMPVAGLICGVALALAIAPSVQAKFDAHSIIPCDLLCATDPNPSACTQACQAVNNGCHADILPGQSCTSCCDYACEGSNPEACLAKCDQLCHLNLIPVVGQDD